MDWDIHLSINDKNSRFLSAIFLQKMYVFIRFNKGSDLGGSYTK